MAGHVSSDSIPSEPSLAFVGLLQGDTDGLDKNLPKVTIGPHHLVNELGGDLGSIARIQIPLNLAWLVFVPFLLHSLLYCTLHMRGL